MCARMCQVIQGLGCAGVSAKAGRLKRSLMESGICEDISCAIAVCFVIHRVSSSGLFPASPSPPLCSWSRPKGTTQSFLGRGCKRNCGEKAEPLLDVSTARASEGEHSVTCSAEAQPPSSACDLLVSGTSAFVWDAGSMARQRGILSLTHPFQETPRVGTVPQTPQPQQTGLVPQTPRPDPLPERSLQMKAGPEGSQRRRCQTC